MCPDISSERACGNGKIAHASSSKICHTLTSLGYVGMQSDDHGDRIDLPTKKPRKSQKNPNPQLRDAQKVAKKVLSQVRIFIEHAIGGMKRSNILVHGFRNRKADFEDDAIGVCAGLWHFVLSC
jgi:hypothetical protein